MFDYSGMKTGLGVQERGSVILMLLVCVLGLFMGGCPIGAAFALFAKKNPMVKVEAEHELTGRNMLILVDCPTERTGLSGIRPLLSRQLHDEVSKHGLVGDVIPAGELATLRIIAEDFSQLSIVQIGRRLFADQVLYVEVVEFRLGTLVDKPAGRGVARVRVSVYGVQEDGKIWPKDRALGREVLVNTPFREQSGQDYRQEFAEDLCERTAESVIKLFRDHEEPRELIEE